MLSKRLQAICDLTPPNTKIIDVGTDHAYVPIYLAKNKNCICLATDISENCIKKAKENIKDLNIETKVTDGLNGINVKDEIIIISGMGTSTIKKIIQNIKTNDLIISTHTHIPELKKYLKKKHYKIHKEKVIKEKQYYIITYYKYKKGKKIKPYYTSNKQYMKYTLKYYQMKYKNTKKIKYKYLTKKITKYLKKM